MFVILTHSYSASPQPASDNLIDQVANYLKSLNLSLENIVVEFETEGLTHSSTSSSNPRIVFWIDPARRSELFPNRTRPLRYVSFNNLGNLAEMQNLNFETGELYFELFSPRSSTEPTIQNPAGCTVSKCHGSSNAIEEMGIPEKYGQTPLWGGYPSQKGLAIRGNKHLSDSAGEEMWDQVTTSLKDENGLFYKVFGAEGVELVDDWSFSSRIHTNAANLYTDIADFRGRQMLLWINSDPDLAARKPLILQATGMDQDEFVRFVAQSGKDPEEIIQQLNTIKSTYIQDMLSYYGHYLNSAREADDFIKLADDGLDAMARVTYVIREVYPKFSLEAFGTTTNKSISGTPRFFNVFDSFNTSISHLAKHMLADLGFNPQEELIVTGTKQLSFSDRVQKWIGSQVTMGSVKNPQIQNKLDSPVNCNTAIGAIIP